ncbi:unnamed protein product [Cuscuta campestris]|uniref:Phytosulfokine n=1 Tax=Cuscuta campestris TaxID=132261 RepID=A0A484L6Y3_9ASTE|nr:unnamed protein product [Cuscuta campestris]
MSKVTSFCTLVFFLLLLAASHGVSRPVRTYSEITPMETNHGDDKWKVEGNCKGEGEEECLMRRTLEAHLDYIYTQKEKQS